MTVGRSHVSEIDFEKNHFRKIWLFSAILADIWYFHCSMNTVYYGTSWNLILLSKSNTTFLNYVLCVSGIQQYILNAQTFKKLLYPVIPHEKTKVYRFD